ncbi:type II secretion system protein GspK [Stenotrophomonas sp.]|uniref:general secretion pathway protein GspK n=1 Tax=Stenotrophomonas sp. TaxID=69392 RepID=UPI0028AD643B|nr:type II secretion system protein GspK [Stenotrophomonas sp.]
MNSRGAALVLVLWLVALLTTTIAAFALTARVEHLQGRTMGDMAAGQELAHAGVDYALSRMRGTPGQPAWHADGRPYRWQFADHRITLRIIDETGKVDLNQASPVLLQGLLRAVGAEQARAQQLAGAIMDWRDNDDLKQPGGGAESSDYAAAGYPYGAKNARFDSIGELQRVLGMDAALYAQLAPHITVFGAAQPNPRFAQGPVLTAMGLDAAVLLAQREREDAAAAIGDTAGGAMTASGSGTYSVDSRVMLVGERQAVTRAVVRLNPEGSAGAPYTVLRWEQGAAAK